VQLHCTLQITTNFTPEYRLRVGDYRVLFELQEQTVFACSSMKREKMGKFLYEI